MSHAPNTGTNLKPMLKKMLLKKTENYSLFIHLPWRSAKLATNRLIDQVNRNQSTLICLTCIFDWLILNSTDLKSWADEQSKLKSKLKLRFITDLLLAQSKAGEGGGVGAGGQLSLHQTMLLVPQVLISSLNPAPFSPLPLTVFWRVGFFSYLRGVGIIGANNWMQIISKLIPCQKLCTNFLPILLVVFHLVFIIIFLNWSWSCVETNGSTFRPPFNQSFHFASFKVLFHGLCKSSKQLTKWASLIQRLSTAVDHQKMATCQQIANANQNP